MLEPVTAYKLIVVGEEEKVVGIHLVGRDSAEIVCTLYFN
jgi:hypothetical protein